MHTCQVRTEVGGGWLAMQSTFWIKDAGVAVAGGNEGRMEAEL